MSVRIWMLVLVLVLLAWSAALLVNRRRVRRYDGSGDPANSVVVFVEPLQWLFIIWGFGPFGRGLRAGGGRQHLRLFCWSGAAGALLVIPDFVRRKRLIRKSERLAKFIRQRAAEHPGSAISIVAYSTGCYIAIEAAKRLDADARVGAIVLLAGALSPRYDLTPLRDRVRAIHCFYSYRDCFISGLAPTLFGSNDGRHGPACGMVGFRDPPPFVTQHAWTPRLMRLGYFGDHFTVASSRFIAQRVAPLLDGAK